MPFLPKMGRLGQIPLGRALDMIRALILAAGRGQRMRPLTDSTPKPLLKVHGKTLIEWHIEALASAGIKDIIINTAWLEHQFPEQLGDGQRWQVRLHYSMEARDHGGALETAGGIRKALPLLSPLGTEPFWVVSGDIYAPNFIFSALDCARFNQNTHLAHLWLVPNPPYHTGGDFSLQENGFITQPLAHNPTWTYANIALIRPALVAHLQPGLEAPLAPELHRAAQQQLLSGELWHGQWENVGTPTQLSALNQAKG